MFYLSLSLSFLFSSFSTILLFPFLNFFSFPPPQFYCVRSSSTTSFNLYTVFSLTKKSTSYRPYIDPRLNFFFQHSFVNSETVYNHRHISIVFPPAPHSIVFSPPPSPHFYCFPQPPYFYCFPPPTSITKCTFLLFPSITTTATTFLLFLSTTTTTFLLFPSSTTTTTFLFFSPRHHHHHHHHISTVFTPPSVLLFRRSQARHRPKNQPQAKKAKLK